MALTATWDGTKLVLEQRQNSYGLYPGLDRFCAKLKRRGFRIQRTGQGNYRYAFPENPKYGHPRDTMTVGVPVEVNA